MAASTSPTTIGFAPARFRETSEATYSSGPTAAHAAGRGGSMRWGTPRTDDECERILLLAQLVPTSSEWAEYLAGFLGASNRLWTAPRRARLARALGRIGVDAIPPTFRAVARAPRQEVIDDAVEALVRAVDVNELTAWILAALLLSNAEALEDGSPEVHHPAVRATIARVLGQVGSHRTRELRLRALSFALTDAASEVRDAAIQALADSRDPVARNLLEERRPHEREPFVLEAIDDALADLGDR